MNVGGGKMNDRGANMNVGERKKNVGLLVGGR